MNKFNLTFKGEILPGKNPQRVRTAFAKLFGIDDPERVEGFFSGETIILRRDLDRKTAADYFAKLRKLGAVSELEKVTVQQTVAVIASRTPPSPEPEPAPAAQPKQEAEDQQPLKRGMDHDILERKPGQVDQSWAVSARPAKPDASQKTTEENTTEDARLKAEEQERVAEVRARRKAQQAEAARRAAEEAAERKSEQLRQEQKEVDRQQALQEKSRRKVAAVAAQQKAIQKEAERKAAEEAQRQQAIREEAARKQAEEAARQQAVREEAARKEAEEAARQKAIREEAARKAAEEAARQKAIREEAERKAAEEAARQQAIREEAQRKAAAAAAAQRKAEEQAKKAEQEAQRLAAREEAKRKAAAEVARKKARKEQQQREARAAAARRKAEEQAEREAAAERKKVALQQEKLEQEKARLKAAEEAALREAQQAEQEARLKTRQAEVKRQAAEDAVRRRAELEEKQQAEAAAVAARAEKKRREVARLSQQKTEKDAQARLKRERKEQARRETAARAAQQTALAEATQKDQQAQRQAMEEQAIGRGARELSRQQGIKSVTAQVKTRLEVPHGNKRDYSKKAATQAGAANLYSLQAFRSTTETKGRAELSHVHMRRYLGSAGIALACLLLLAGIYLNTPTVAAITGASAAAIDEQLRPVLLAGDALLIHDRAGIGTGSLPLTELGIERIQNNITFNSGGQLLALGGLAASGEAQATTLMRCQLDSPQCAAISGASSDDGISAFAVHPLDGSLFVINSKSGQLIHSKADGSEISAAEIALPARPRLQLEAGLLLMNSAAGEAISVMRYDSSAFGKQLDEILLLPPAAVEAGQNQVHDFLWSAENWWVTLLNAESGEAGVYRYDPQWNYLGQVPLAAGSKPQQLVNWGSKTLVVDSNRVALQRFNAQGEAEAPLVSDLLQQMVTQQRRDLWLSDLAWRTVTLMLIAVIVVGAVLGWLASARALVYRARKTRGAQPIDALAEPITWVDPLESRKRHFRRLNIFYCICCITALTVAIVNSVPVTVLLALLLFFLGPALSLLLLQSTPIGHIGSAAGQLILVDHTSTYHMGSDARLQHCGPILLIDDVVVFIGTRLLPAFNPQQIKTQVMPLAESGIKVDRKTVLVKLLHSQHPLARSIQLIASCTLLAALILGLQL